ncbi:hypothetical protein HDV02_000285 [Globomyces sp. JEL0801]|nr:hypothetical protein HDV02_000285 [Globomyces sp. JEL0801]
MQLRSFHNKSYLIRTGFSAKLKPMLEPFPSLLTIPIQCASGYLSQIRYSRYFEHGRIAYFDQVLKPYLTEERFNMFLSGRGIGPVLKSYNVNYKGRAEYGDTLIVANTIQNIKRDRWDHYTLLISENQEKVVGECTGTIVTYDHDRKCKADIPVDIQEAYANL